MKRLIKATIKLIVIITVFSTQVFSQGFYINVGAGYGLSPVANAMGNDYNNVLNWTTTATFDGTDTNAVYSQTETTDSKKINGTGSYGKGTQVGATVGYKFTNNISAELGVSYLIGFKINSGKNSSIYSGTETYIDLTDHSNDSTFTSGSSNSYESQSSGHMLRFIPAIKLSMGKGKLQPYIKLGMVVGIITKFNMSNTETRTHADLYSDTEETEIKYSGGISIGYAGSLGANYKISEKWGMFAECGIITQNWTPKKSVITKYVINGDDRMKYLSTFSKEKKYVDSFTETNSNTDYTSPGKSLKVHYPFSSIALNIGVSYTFGRKQIPTGVE